MRRGAFALWGAIGGLLIRCGDDDRPIDGLTEGPITITVSGASGPIADTDVIIHDASGLPTARLVTGLDGRASPTIHAGAMVTVLLNDHGNLYRATMVGVRPDDQLLFTSPRLPVETVGTAMISIAAYAGASVYVIESSCASIYTANVSEPIELEVRSNCLARDRTLVVLASARDANGDLLAVTSVRDLPWEAPMNVTLPAWRDPASFTLLPRSPPPGATSVWLEVLYEVDGLLLGQSRVERAIAPGGEATMVIRYATGFADRIETRLGVQFGAERGGRSVLTQRRDALPATAEVDLTRDLLPRVLPPTSDRTDPQRPVMSWTLEDDGAAGADCAIAELEWTSETTERWRMILPAEVRTATIPALPEALFAWRPGGSPREGDVELFDADWVTSYGQLRNQVGFGPGLGDRSALFSGRGAVLVRESVSR